MSRIRIAQRAWEGASAVDKIGPQTCGVNLVWVEIEGVRIADVESATVQFADGCAVPELTMRPFGTVEIVYLNRDLEEIGSVDADPRTLAGNEYGYGIVQSRPRTMPSDLDRAIGERDRALARVAELEEWQRQHLAAELMQ